MSASRALGIVAVLGLLLVSGWNGPGPSTGVASAPHPLGSIGPATAVTYSVAFNETGLPAGTSWSITISGNLISTTKATIVFAEPNGSYSYTISAVPGFQTPTTTGSVNVAGAATSVAIAFTPFSYAITFGESGLPSGTNWTVTLGGVAAFSNNQTIRFAEPNGSYAFTVGAMTGYSTSPASSTVRVAGSPLSQNISFAPVSGATYALTFSESGLPNGTSWGVRLGATTGRSSGPSLSFSVPNGAYNYSVTTLPGWRANAFSGSLTVNGQPITVTVSWSRVTYAVTFTENGLPNSTSWAVTLGSTLVSSTARSIAFVDPNGTYPYSVSGVPGWRASTYQGSVSVQGGPSSVGVNWSKTTYSVRFTESGLPTGTSWSLDLGSNPGTSTTTTLTFAEPNGSYAYSVTAILGYSISPDAATVTVAAAPVAVTIAFASIAGAAHSVTFSETGLPSGTAWSVTLNRTSGATTGPSVAFRMPNGTFAYNVSGVAGWTPTPSSGSTSVLGANVAVSLTWTATTFAVTFNESGLSAGTSWSVSLGTTQRSSTSSAIVFAEPNGSYAFTIGVVPGWHAKAYSGSVSVSGAAVAVGVSWTLVTYTVDFGESGLPTGTSWTVTLGSTQRSGSNASIAFSEPNGSYAFLVGAISGYAIAPSASTIVVSGTAVSSAIAFSSVAGSTYTLTISESGLAGGTLWAVTLGANVVSSGGTSLAFREPNGTYSFTVGALAGWRAGAYTGSISVSGAAATATVAWSRVTYSVTFTESGLPAGTAWGVTLGGTLQSSTNGSIAFAEPNGTIAYTLSNVPGHHATAYSGTVTVNGAAQSLSVAWTLVAYPVTFSESGLPIGTTWGVGLGSTLLSASTSSIAFAEANGTYLYSVSAVSGWIANAYSGSVSVNGASVSVAVGWSQISYAVTFTESGLPIGTNWTVSLGGTARASTSSSIAFSEPNGTFAYSVGGIAGWRPTTLSGAVRVSGAPVSVAVPWSRVTYFVTFTESGLASGTSWTVTLGGSPSTSTGSSLTFSEPNGSYAYSVSPVPGFSISPSAATLTVSGAPITRAVSLSAISGATYSVTFTENGLPAGTSWTATLGGISGTTSGTSVAFLSGNGSPAYSISGGVPLRPNPSSGSVTVNGAAVGVSVAWSQPTYVVTFTESGLPSGSSWSVTLAGAFSASVGTSISFSEPNGTWNYTVSNVPGWSASAYSGSVRVNGAGATVSLVWIRTTFLVTFTETGLPSGTPWSVTLGSLTHNSTTTTISFSEPNGSFAYRVGGVAGWRANAYAGSVVVSGSPIAVGVAWSQVTYTLTFFESGLPAGTTWTVLIGGAPVSATTSSIQLAEANGTYSYSLPSIPGWRPGSASGSVTVNGAATTVLVSYSRVTYSVTFTESGLTSGTQWGVTVAGTYVTTNNASLSVAEPNGSYGYTVSNLTGWTANSYSGTVVVNGGPAAVAVDWTEVRYAVTFTESGLPAGTLWGVSFDGTARSSTNSSINFTAPDGTFSYRLLAVAGWQPGSPTGSVSVNGKASSVVVAFAVYRLAVTFTESGLPAGTSWSVTLNGSALASTAASISFAEPNGTYSFVVAGVPGFRTGAYTGSVIVNGGPAGITVLWTRATYAVVLSESGLPPGTSWSAIINGTILASTNSTIVFPEPNGTWAYRLLDVPGWQPSARTGAVIVDGQSVSIGVAFSQPTYPVVLTETGLPAGTTWDVTLGGALQTASSASITFQMPNGTYPFTIGPLAGWSASVTSGSVTVAGGSVGVAVSWSETTYAVTFTENGLPSGTAWSVSLMGLAVTTANRSISFADPNGSVRFVVLGVPGYRAAPASGSLTIAGGPVLQFVNWTTVTFPVTFNRVGLPSGTSWSVTLGGDTETATGAAIAFAEPNGSFDYAIASVDGWHPKSGSGSVTVSGLAVGVSVVWSVTTYPVTFTASGLPSGTAWTVTIGSTVASSTGTTITILEPNGTFDYSVGTVSGYDLSPSAGSVHVASAPVAQAIAATATSAGPTLLGASGPAGAVWTLTALVAIAVALLLLGMLWRARQGPRRRRRPRRGAPEEWLAAGGPEGEPAPSEGDPPAPAPARRFRRP